MRGPISERAYLRRRQSNAEKWAFFGVLGAATAAVLVGWLLLPKSLRAVDPVERAFWKWVEENEGDPGSVELLLIEIRYPPPTVRTAWGREASRLVHVKYRHKAPLFGIVVTHQIFDASRDGELQELSPGEFETYQIGWNNYPIE